MIVHASSEDWQTRYAAKIATPEAAVRLIQPRKRILIGSGAAEPGRLVEALVSHGDTPRRQRDRPSDDAGAGALRAPGLEHRFRHTAFFIGANVREAVQEGRADFMPVFLSEIPQLIRSRPGRASTWRWSRSARPTATASSASASPSTSSAPPSTPPT